MPSTSAHKAAVSSATGADAAQALAGLLSAPSLEAFARCLLALLPTAADGPPPRLLYALRWPDAIHAVPAGAEGLELALAEAALTAPEGRQLSPDRRRQATLLAAHSGGGAVVLLAAPGQLPQLPHWPLEALLPLLSARLQELIEIALLHDSVRQLEHTERVQRALFAITEMAAEEEDRAAMLRGLHGIVGGLMYAENFYIALHDAHAGTVEFIYFADAHDSRLALELDKPRPLEDMRHGLTWHVLTSGQALRGDLDEIEVQVRGRAPLRRQGAEARHWLGVPMLEGTEVRGVIAVQTYNEAVQFTAADQALLSYVGSHILTALERRRSRAELEALVAARTEELAQANAVLTSEVQERERGERLQAALYRIAELAGKDIGIAEFCAVMHAIVGSLIPAQNFYIALVSDDGGTLNFPYFADETPGAPVSRPMGNGITEYLIRIGEPLLTDRPGIYALAAAGHCEVMGTAALSWLGVPLIGARGVIGAVVVQSYRPEVTYGANDQSLLAFVSYHIASSLERRRAAADLRASHQLLEQRVEQRTRELSTTLNELAIANERLRESSLRDGLTGVFNRRYFDSTFEPMRDDCRAKGRDFSVLVADIDHFKQINDGAGHLIGDDCLHLAASVIERTVGDSGQVVRYGGEEFVVLMPDVDEIEMRSKANSIRAAIASSPLLTNGVPIPMTISVGGAHAAPGDSIAAMDLLQQADEAMYRAKHQGRNRVVVH